MATCNMALKLFLFLVAVAVLRGATGLPEHPLMMEDPSEGIDTRSGRMEDHLERQDSSGCRTKKSCKKVGGKCQPKHETCHGEWRYGKAYCNKQKTCGCCIPAGCALDGRAYQNGSLTSDRCILLECIDGSWEYHRSYDEYLAWNECNHCFSTGDTKINMRDHHSINGQAISNYLVDGTGTYSFSQIGLEIPANVIMEAKFEYFNENQKGTHITNVIYKELGIQVELDFPCPNDYEYCNINPTDPRCEAKVLVNGFKVELKSTFSSVALFFGLTGTVFIVNRGHHWPLTNQWGRFYIVGSQGTSVRVDYGGWYAVYAVSMASYSLENKVHGLCGVFTGGTPTGFTESNGSISTNIEEFVQSWKIEGNNDCKLGTTSVTAQTTTAATTTELSDMCASAGGELVNGKCLTFNTAYLSWSNAKKACADDGGRLASFDDTNAVFDYITTNHPSHYFWTGGSDALNEGTFTWLDGRTFVPSPWYPNRPWATPAEGEPYDCIEVKGGAGYGDYACRAPRAYICEIDTCALAGGEWVKDQCLTFNLVKDGLTWSLAKDACAAVAGRGLAQFHDTEAAHEYIEANHAGTWFSIGATDTAKEDTWKWLDGEEFIPNPWYDRHPNNNGRNWLFVHSAFGYDADTSVYPAAGYICEIDPSSTAPYTTTTTEELTTSPKAPKCKAPWFRVGSQCFYLHGPIEAYNSLNWTSARSFCQDLFPGGDLAQPRDIQALAVYLFSIHHTFFWMGGSDLGTEGDWHWLDGTTVTGWRTSAGQPVNVNGDEDCLAIHPVYQSANSLFSQPCDRTLYMKLVCERPYLANTE